MKTIWKFSLPIDDQIEIQMPPFAEILSVGYQPQFRGEIMLWALVSDHYKDKKDWETRKFKIRGTGHPCDGISLKDHIYLGTVIMLDGGLVFHVFEYEKPMWGIPKN